MKYLAMTPAAAFLMAAVVVSGAPAAHGDNKRLNDGVVANVYTVQHQAGCTNDIKINHSCGSLPSGTPGMSCRTEI